MEIVAVSGEVRSDLGKKATKAVRKEGRIPAVLYGGDGNIHFSVAPNEVKDLVYTSQFKLADVSVDGKAHRCIIKDLQFHPLTDEIVHIDFRELTAGTPVKVDVPLRFTGNSEGVKAGGKLLQKVRRLRIKTVPENLVDHISVDISALQLGQSIRVREIEPSEGIEIMNSPGVPLATIEIPRALRSATSAAEKEARKV